MYCPYCRTSLRPNAKFCNQCGRPMPEAAAPSAEPATLARPTPLPADVTAATAAPAESLPVDQQPTAILTSPPPAGEDRASLPDHNGEVADISTYPTQFLAPNKNMPTISTLPPADVAQAEATNAPAAVDTAAAVTTPDAPPSVSAPAPPAAPVTPGEPATEEPASVAPADAEAPPAELDEPLEAGTSVEERYRVEALVRDEPGTRVYRVTSIAPPALCWSCGNVQERDIADRFCDDCGADLIGHEYTLRETLLVADEPEAASTAMAADATSFVVGRHRYHIEAPAPEAPLFPHGVRLDVASLSDVGHDRMGSPNEDSVLVLAMARVHESISQPLGLFVVADGMGGHASGQDASRKAISVIAEHMLREIFLPAVASTNTGNEDELAAALKAAIQEANAALIATNTQEQSDMGCTVTAAVVHGDTAYIANVGDSRTYLLTATELRQITTDHSLVAQLLAGGLITADEVYTHPQRNQIFRSLGDRQDMAVDLFVQQLQPGDRLILCCDGLWEMVHNEQMETILRATHDVETACRELVDAANANGGEDNISVIVVEVAN
jgi:serine/threonine protein phosphatase PrpC